MNARLIKETRDLLPIFAGALLLIVVPELLWPHAGFGYLLLGVACVVMAGSSFGNEFQQRTLSLLLSQPIPRSLIWRDKMLVLGAGIVTSLAAFLVCLAVRRPAFDGPGWLAMVLTALCAFCGAPFWTLLLRHGIGGMVAAVAAPGGIVAAYALVVDQLGGNKPAAPVAAIQSLLFLYCALVYWLGYAKFKRLEAVDGPSRELGLPAGVEAFFVRPLTKALTRFHSPFATLLKKEFRLQQSCFMLAGLFVLLAVASACLYQRHRDWAEGIWVVDCAVYVMILPLIAGAISLAEEKGWGIAEWHLTLPPSALKQWSAKMLATLSTSLALGLLLPIALILAGQALFSLPGPEASLPPTPEILCWMLGSLLLTSLAVYAASFSNSTLRAILAAVAINIAGCGVCALVGHWVADLTSRSLWMYMHVSQDVSQISKALIPPLLAGGLFFMLCVVQWFAWSNFRRCALSARRIVVQLLVIYSALGLITLVFVWTLFLPSLRYYINGPLPTH